jgi:hypothetical protein
MNEELWTCELPDGRTFRCVKSQIMKKKFRNPETGKKVNPLTGQDEVTA